MWPLVFILIVVPLGAVGCGGGSSPSSPTSSQPRVLSVGGTYTVTKLYTDTTCGTDLASLTATIIVEHTPGSTSIAITEGFGTYRGQVAADGRFEAAQLVPAHDPPLRITLRDGRFTATGLEARNVWEMFRNGQLQPATCTGALSYSGRRTAGTNTIP
jgi:hypothetical protein